VYATYLVCLDSLGRDVPLMLEHLPDAGEYQLAADEVRRIAVRMGIDLG